MKATFKSFGDRLASIFDKSKKIYRNGADNNYSEKMEAVRLGSVTASMASEIMAQFIVGKGFGEFDNFEFDDLKVIELAEDIAEDLVNNRGVFIHVAYDANFDIAGYKVLPFQNNRIGRKDSSGYSGKYIFNEDWSDRKNNEIIFDAFNPNKEIVSAQVEASGGFEKYKGQVMFITTDRKRVYPLSRIDSVFEECENEARASAYKNSLLERGFFGKTIVITKPLISDDVFNDMSEDGRREYYKAESERQKFKDTLAEFVGSKNNGSLIHFEMEYEGDSFEEAILFKNIESNIDPDLFLNLEESAFLKILMAYKNLPTMLVKSPDTAMFGNSGEAIHQAQLMYQNGLFKERNMLETIINDLWKLHKDFDNKYKTLIPLIDEEINNDTDVSEIQAVEQFD